MLLCRRLHSRVHLPKPNICTIPFRKNYSHERHNSTIGLQVPGPQAVSSSAAPSSGSLPKRACALRADMGQVARKSEVEKKSRRSKRSTPVSPNIDLIRQAMQSHNSVHVDEAVKRLLQGNERGAGWNLSSSELDFLLRDEVASKLSSSTIAMLLTKIPNKSSTLPENTISHIVKRVERDNTDASRVLLRLLLPHILRHLERTPPSNPHSVSYRPPTIVRIAFRYIHVLLPGNEQNVVELFQVLVELGFIPPQASIDSSSSQSFEQIIRITLAKASLHWNWGVLVEQLLCYMLDSPVAPDLFTLRHATDSLYSLLISSSRLDLARSLNIIRLLHRHTPVPDGLIRQFYDRAHDLDAATLAEDMYDFSCDPSVRDHHSYPPPQGKALTWLLTYLTHKSEKVYLARSLASDVVDGHIPVPVGNRAQLIAAIADKGFSSSARSLWERYATGKDSYIIRGNSALMLRLTSLFTNMARDIDAKIGSLDYADPKIVDLKVKSSDLRSFVELVIAKYREHHDPVAKADHRVITSYARACFIIGKYAEGFNAFRTLLRRKEILDRQDVNVALTAIAQQNSDAAASLIEKMIDYKMHPDVISIATVLHHASAQKNAPVVEEMTQQALTQDGLLVNLEAFSTLVRAIVDVGDDESRDAALLKLRSAWKLVHRFTEKGNAPSVQLGNYLVSQAVKAEDSALAYNFWNALLKKSGEWDDEQQTQQRRAIMRLARIQMGREEISFAHYEMIVSHLEKRPS